eukprot:TRINITY_DN809_c0_g2_i7.p1 TRINITY_DN809_c0_g2~~TRINITY_DN809_c0_g2_i7.p1  ORF type:complete len:349 (-),score=77.86 TRINITY_DN809_c0_g2_i7:103-1149(-)
MFQLFLLAFVCFTLAQPGGQANSGRQGGQYQVLNQFVQEATRLCHDCDQALQWIQQHVNLTERFQNLQTSTFLIPDDSSMWFVKQRLQGMSTDQIMEFMRLHVIRGLVPQLHDGATLITFSGVPISVKKQGGQFILNDEARVKGSFRQLSDGNGFYVIEKLQQQENQNSSGVVQTELSTTRSKQQDIWETLRSKRDVRKFFDFLNRVGDLKSQLYSNQSNRTFLIPVDHAMNSFPYNLSDMNKTVVRKLLMFYIIPREVVELHDNQILPTLLQGDFIHVKKQGGHFLLYPSQNQQSQHSQQQHGLEEAIVKSKFVKTNNMTGFYEIDELLIPISLKQQIDQSHRSSRS